MSTKEERAYWEWGGVREGTWLLVTEKGETQSQMLALSI
jgi:hypothetical protein